MAGVKGKSGGARPNTGGARPGAGRKPNPPVPVVLQPDGTDMLTFLQNVALGLTEASPIQVRAAVAAVQYTHTKRGDGGKKEEQAEAAKKAASGGRFGLRQPPKLIVNNKG